MSVTENTLILETTQGPVTIEMRPDLAPNHVARIKELVREGFYDGIVFHRVIDGGRHRALCDHLPKSSSVHLTLRSQQCKCKAYATWIMLPAEMQHVAPSHKQA